jgi:hypothetical protein
MSVVSFRKPNGRGSNQIGSGTKRQTFGNGAEDPDKEETFEESPDTTEQRWSGVVSRRGESRRKVPQKITA